MIDFILEGDDDMAELEINEQKLKEIVRKEYGSIARKGGSCCQSSCCGTAAPKETSKKVGYTDAELATVPFGSNLGLGCGNPTALASIKERDTVLDLGSGAGFDCFLASSKVGPRGKVIGVDMTEEMIQSARANALKGNYGNVEFRQGEIEKLPVEDDSVDVIISNCVINLVPDKKQAFKEAFRVLKPGGRLMVSDIVLLKELPDFIKESAEAYTGCVSGALLKEDYLGAIKSAGFREVNVIDESEFPLDLASSGQTCQIDSGDQKASIEALREIGDSIISIKVGAVKPNAS
jgi:arsenite methyltransferase